MKNKWRFFAVIMAVVLCMTVFSVTAYAGGDMVDSTMGDPTMETPTATTQPENTNTGEQTPNGQTLTVLVTENADGSHTVTIGDRSWTLPAKREQAGKVVNVRTYLNLRTGHRGRASAQRRGGEGAGGKQRLVQGGRAGADRLCIRQIP